MAMINGSDGAKLSKRHGATDVMEYKDMGYLPEALLNFLVRLGWAHGDDEIFSINEMINLFDPHDINKSASTYNLSKLEWLNAHYIKTLPFERLADAMMHFDMDFRAIDKGQMLLDMLRARAKTLVELKSAAYVIINAPQSYDEKALKKFVNDDSKALVSKYLEALSAFNGEASAANLEEYTMKFLENEGKALKDLAQNIRIALTGGSVSPSIFEMMEFLGMDAIKTRLNNFIKNA